MSINKVELSDKFHIWVAITNQIIHELNNNIVLEARQKLKTVNKTTLIDSINEIYDNTLSTKEDTTTNFSIEAKSLSGKIKLQTGSESNGNSYIEFYDDTNNLYKKLVFNHIEQEWYIENKNNELVKIIHDGSDIDGSKITFTIKQLTTSENNQYIGKIGEFVQVDQTKLYIHNGVVPGGLEIPLSNSSDSKVKVSQTDSNNGYLNEKIIAGKGITIGKNTNSGNEQLTINNTLSNELPDTFMPNSFLKRNNNNTSFENCTINNLKNDLGITMLGSYEQPIFIDETGNFKECSFKFAFVNELPSEPDENTIYFIYQDE